MYEKISTPNAAILMESMRSIGYSFSSAIADLLDNSISANCKNIYIYMLPSDEPEMIILDDGDGMGSLELEEAMRYGSKDPLEKRSKNDLGRFGLGLKAASLSQCKELIVVSKKGKSLSSYSWDLNYVLKKDSWTLKGYSEEEILKFPQIDELNTLKNGTYLLLRNFDRIKNSTSDLESTINNLLSDMNEHISLVFHRFLEKNLKIHINNRKIVPKDPFLKDHKLTQPKEEKNFKVDGKKITLKPYILPIASKINKKDEIKIGGKESLKTAQGFYIYRNKRLIIWGTWFRVARKDELSKYARVRVDIPNSLDYIWSIDIKKSTAKLPDKIKSKMKKVIFESIEASEKIPKYRGRKERENEDCIYIWNKVKERENYKYEINREIPQIKILEETLDKKQLNLLNNIISSIEENLPLQSLYLDIGNGNISDEKKNEKEKIENLLEEIKDEINYFKSKNKDINKYIKMYKTLEPYCNYPEIIKKMEEFFDGE